MSNLIKARRGVLDLGQVQIDCYELPSGQKRIGIGGAAKALGYAKNWINRLPSSSPKKLERLHSRGWTGRCTDVQLAKDRGSTVATTLSVEDFLILVKEEAMDGNQKACEMLGWARPEKLKTSKPKREKREGSFIYCIGSVEAACCKIGYSGNPAQRLKGLQTGFPFRLSILWQMPGTFETEKAIHESLSDLRLEGEWFDIMASTLVDLEDT